MITYDKPFTVTAHIHSLDGAMGEIKQANNLIISWTIKA